MHQLIIVQGKPNIDRYLAKLKKRGHTYELIKDKEFPWSGTEPDWKALLEYTDLLYSSRRETIDAIKWFMDDYKRPKPSSGAIFYANLKYPLQIVKIRPQDDETADHEDMHLFGYYVRLYLNFDLATLFGVKDWDEDVVHARDPRFTEYEYDEVWKIIEPKVTEAIKKRKELSAHPQLRLRTLLEQVAILQRKLLYLKEHEETKPEKLACPLPAGTFHVSQSFGIPDAEHYPLTKHHVGIDLAAPAGTPIYAPGDIEIVAATYSDILGNNCLFHFILDDRDYYGRFLHMQFPVKPGTYRKGDFIGRVGATGKVTGPHLHFDAMEDVWSLEGVGPHNFRDRFVDPSAIMEGV